LTENSNLPLSYMYYHEATQHKQELSYRKQIARQLRTQYVEGVYSHNYYHVTLKSKLRPLKVIENGTI